MGILLFYCGFFFSVVSTLTSNLAVINMELYEGAISLLLSEEHMHFVVAAGACIYSNSVNLKLLILPGFKGEKHLVRDKYSF